MPVPKVQPLVSTGPKSGRFEHLDGLRGLAALYVVFGHIVMTVWDSNADRYATGWIGELLRWLPSWHGSVVLFIVLSGFCLTLPVLRNQQTLRGSIGSFYFKRCRRILPPYYGCLIVSILLGCTLLNSKTGTIWDASVPVSTKGVLSHLLLVHNVTGDIAAINYPLWSIAVECQIYLIFPLLLVLWRNIGLWRLAFLCLTVAYPIVYLTRHMVVSGLNLYFVWLFVMGMLAAYSTTGRDPLLNWMRRHAPLMMIIGFVLLAGVTLILGVEGGYFAMRYGRYFDIFLGAAAFLLLVGTSNGNGVLRTMLSWKPLVTVGTFSYSLYLLHAPFVQLAWQYGASRMPISDETRFALLVFAGIPLIMLISYGFFLLFERPFLNPSSRGVARVADKGAEHLAMVQAAV